MTDLAALYQTRSADRMGLLTISDVGDCRLTL
jgi:hypothetical protein